MKSLSLWDIQRVLVVKGAYLSVKDILPWIDSDEKYDVAAVYREGALSFLKQNDNPLPHLCICEWGGPYDKLYPHISRYCNSKKIAVLTAITRENLESYSELHFLEMHSYIVFPIEKTDLLLRMAIELRTHPFPMDEGFTRIDKSLSINFDTGNGRLGANNYFRLTFENVGLLYLLYQEVNKWCSAEALANEIGYDTHAPVMRRMSELRKIIEHNPKQPKYLLSNGQGYYMLRSLEYPKVHQPYTFIKMMNRLRKIKSRRKDSK